MPCLRRALVQQSAFSSIPAAPAYSIPGIIPFRKNDYLLFYTIHKPIFLEME
ncbi:MAG: hypothetical protein HGA59_07695 [Chlorobiaceae bacterium]|nr:hypothetical protein [Chlorobiaceae bacterium]NTV17158.1 hypothetical protein [Chlorobiaceae bacterium]